MSMTLSSSATVIIDDDDTEEPIEIIEEDDVEITGNEKPTLANSSEIDSTNNNSSKPNQKATRDGSEPSFFNALTNNIKMNKIVKWCMHAPNNIGMERIINKTLIPMFRDAHNDFKGSTELTEILNKTLKLLKHDPNHKFLYMKQLCEKLKNSRFRKKVPLITLSTSLKGKKKKRIAKKSSPPKPKVPVKTFGIIFNTDRMQNNDSDEEIVELDKSDDEIISLDDDIVNTENSRVDDNSNKENNVDSDDNIELIECTKPPDRLLETEICNTEEIEATVPEIVSKTNTNNVPTNSHCNILFDSAAQINLMEIRIESHKKLIADMEEMEVCDDSESSPYVTCARLKSEIVQMYKSICKLKDVDIHLVKRREVRLKVQPGHPPGPATRLQTFLNNSIDDRGMVAFPDFQDVVACVNTSNKQDKLNWNKQQISKEALALFRQCGQALRKQRQKREYRDLLSLVKKKPTLDHETSDDPADHDPELFAKLENNKRLALTKEEELLDRYSNYMSKKTSPGDTSISDCFTHITPEIRNTETQNNECEIGESSNYIRLNESGNFQNHSSMYGKNFVVPRCNQNTIEQDRQESEFHIEIEPAPAEKESQRRVQTSFTPFSGSNKVEIEIDFGTVDVDVKTETTDQISDGTSDFQSRLDNLGNNYTCSVFDIEDPFLVIEISSDESSSDEL